MKRLTRVHKDCGFLEMQNGRIFDIEGEMTDNGCVFKDTKAFEIGEGICYVGEYDLDDIQEELTNLQALYENGEMTDEEYRVKREEIILNGGETRHTIMQQVFEAFGDDYMLTMEQAVVIAEDVLSLADWACISTYLAENVDIVDMIHADNSGLFKALQHKAIEADMTPKEYCEANGLKPLNYKELNN